MTGNPFHFLFVFFFFLFISSARSEIEPNPQLELNISCSTGDNSCSSEDALCNSAGKCQCRFGYFPNDDYCAFFPCDSPGLPSCSQFYEDPYAKCPHAGGFCGCPWSFKLNVETQKCELEKPDTRPLGGSCVADHQCGYQARCTTTGECRCPAGRIPETQFSCDWPHCSSNDFCHANATANTVCDGGNCQCVGPTFEQNSDTFECVRVQPDVLPIGARCGSSDYCGEGTRCTTGSEPICKCKLGYEATSDTVCEPVRCSKDEYCHKKVSPLTTCMNKGQLDWSYCSCKEGYYEDHNTHECSKHVGEEEETPEPPTEDWPEASTPGCPEPPTDDWPEVSTPGWPEVSTPGRPGDSDGTSTEPPTDVSTGTPTEGSDIGEPCGREKLYKSLWLKCELRRPSCAGSIDLKLKVNGYGPSKDLPYKYEQIE